MFSPGEEKPGRFESQRFMRWDFSLPDCLQLRRPFERQIDPVE